MRILVVNNRGSASGRGVSPEYVAALVHAGAKVATREMSSGVELASLLEDAGEYDRVVAGGGDGTASGIAYELRGSGVPLLTYPCGTANLLALNLGLPWDPVHLAAVTLAGRTAATDLGEMTFEGDGERKVGFAIMAGAGFDASVMAGAEGLKPLLGQVAYFLSAAGNLQPKEADIRLEIDGEPIEARGTGVLVVNFAKIQFDLAVTHSSDGCDGTFEVAVMTAKNPIELIPTIGAAILDRVADFPDRPGLEIREARRVKVDSDPPLPVEYDGEATGAFTTPFSCEVLPGAAQLVVP